VLQSEEKSRMMKSALALTALIAAVFALALTSPE
jgi:hypothetical protein